MTTTKGIRFNRWLILICVNGTVPSVILWKYHAGEISSAIALLCGAIVLAVCNTVVLLGFQKRSKRDGSPIQRSLVVGVIALAIVALLSTALGLRLLHQRNDYADIAISDEPLSSIEPEQKRLVVELIRRTAAISQEENKAMAEAQKVPMNPAVYAPESFRDKEKIQSTLAQLTNYAEIDFQSFDKQQSVRADFRRKMAVCDAEYLKKWDAERKEQEDREKSANQLEHDWLASVNVLYLFAEQHTRDIAVDDGKTSISDPTVRKNFNDLLAQSKDLHERLESTAQEEVRLQKQAKARIAE